MNPTTKRNATPARETATKAFCRHAQGLDELLEKLTRRASLKPLDCREADWGHVGSEAYARQQVANAALALGLITEDEAREHGAEVD